MLQLVITHCLGCVWYIIGASDAGERNARAKVHCAQSFGLGDDLALLAAAGGSAVNARCSWLELYDMRRGSNAEKYVAAVYWAFSTLTTVGYRAGKGCEIPNFKGSYLGRFPLVLADFWTSDHLSERSRP